MERVRIYDDNKREFATLLSQARIDLADAQKTFPNLQGLTVNTKYLFEDVLTSIASIADCLEIIYEDLYGEEE